MSSGREVIFVNRLGRTGSVAGGVVLDLLCLSGFFVPGEWLVALLLLLPCLALTWRAAVGFVVYVDDDYVESPRCRVGVGSAGQTSCASARPSSASACSDGLCWSLTCRMVGAFGSVPRSRADQAAPSASPRLASSSPDSRLGVGEGPSTPGGWADGSSLSAWAIARGTTRLARTRAERCRSSELLRIEMGWPTDVSTTSSGCRPTGILPPSDATTRARAGAGASSRCAMAATYDGGGGGSSSTRSALAPLRRSTEERPSRAGQRHTCCGPRHVGDRRGSWVRTPHGGGGRRGPSWRRCYRLSGDLLTLRGPLRPHARRSR
jgi:hypothetical protein